jgi:hypothetical protein
VHTHRRDLARGLADVDQLVVPRCAGFAEFGAL